MKILLSLCAAACLLAMSIGGVLAAAGPPASILAPLVLVEPAPADCLGAPSPVALFAISADMTRCDAALLAETSLCLVPVPLGPSPTTAAPADLPCSLRPFAREPPS